MRNLLFFSKLGYFKVINEADYKIPIKEIENVCEYTVFKEAYSRMNKLPEGDDKIKTDIQNAFGEMRTFLEGAPGDEINLSVNGLIKVGQYEMPTYKEIKKRIDRLSTALPQALNTVQNDIPIDDWELVNIGSIIDIYNGYSYKGTELQESDCGMVAEVKELEALLAKYTPSSEYERIIESILLIVKKRFFTFPSAKRET